MDLIVKLSTKDVTYIYGVAKYSLEKLDELKFIEGYADEKRTLSKKIAVNHIVFIKELPEY